MVAKKYYCYSKLAVAFLGAAQIPTVQECLTGQRLAKYADMAGTNTYIVYRETDRERARKRVRERHVKLKRAQPQMHCTKTLKAKIFRTNLMK